jgi:hypothetical protein
VWASLILWVFGGAFSFGIFGSGFILAIVVPAMGLILGLVGRSQIKASNGQRSGLVLASAGIALHILSLVWFLLIIGTPLVLHILLTR